MFRHGTIFGNMYLRRRIAFDIDGTTADTQKVFFESCERISPNTEKLSIAQLIRRYHYVENVPEWGNKPEIKAWCEEFHHNNEAHENIPLYPGTLEGIAQLDKGIEPGAYVSARPDTVSYGTSRWIDKKGLPKAPQYLRPKSVPFEMWRIWKARVIFNLFPLIQAAVEDDPHMPQELQKLRYEGAVFIFGHATHPLANERYIPCPTWEDAATKINEYFTQR